MPTQDESFRYLDQFLDSFRAERHKHKKVGWLTLSSLRKRLCSEAAEYPRLRRSDVQFSCEQLIALRELIGSKEIPVDHLKDYSTALNGHLAALNDRNGFLTIVALSSVATMAFVSAVSRIASSWPAFAITAMAVFLTAMVLFAIIERGQILGWAPTVHEFLLLLDHEITRIHE